MASPQSAEPPPPSERLHRALAVLVGGGHLDEAHTAELFTEVLRGEVPPEQVAALLALLQAKGVCADELVGAARVMRAFVTPVPVDDATRTTGPPIIDTCGTGGAPKTFNISTASAIVAASTGIVRVAKHGNRSRTGRGSAEVLAQLGVNLDASPEQQARCLEEAGVCFSFAVRHHPAMVHAVGPRKALGFPTIFNLLGPLTNPAGASRQLLGVYNAGKAELVAQALAALGAERAWVVHGGDGLDEITTTTTTRVWRVADGTGVSEFTIDPQQLGLELCELDALRVPTVEAGAELIRAILSGTRGAPRAIVELNAAAALVVGGVCDGIADTLPIVRDAIGSGAANRTLDRLVEVSHAG